MSLLSRFAPRFTDRRAAEAGVPELKAECGHRELAPRWHDAADIGKKEKVESFTCTACKQSFTPAEAERLAA